jgi:hypothetical protein
MLLKSLSYAQQCDKRPKHVPSILSLSFLKRPEFHHVSQNTTSDFEHLFQFLNSRLWEPRDTLLADVMTAELKSNPVVLCVVYVPMNLAITHYFRPWNKVMALLILGYNQNSV